MTDNSPPGRKPDARKPQGTVTLPATPPAGPSPFGPDARILAVNCARLLSPEVLSAPSRNVTIASYASLDRGYLDRVAPEIVVGPLFGEEFDILDLIQKLEALGYTGQITALAGPMPNRSGIEAEIARSCRSTTFSLHLLPPPDSDAG
ncbi:MAG: hypothetical protein RLZZ528_1109 [Pseudomonadota bacterium]